MSDSQESASKAMNEEEAMKQPKAVWTGTAGSTKGSDQEKKKHQKKETANL